MPNKDISATVGVKLNTVASIIHNYRHGLLSFKMKERTIEPHNKKINEEILRFMFNKTVNACKH